MGACYGATKTPAQPSPYSDTAFEAERLRVNAPKVTPDSARRCDYRINTAVDGIYAACVLALGHGGPHAPKGSTYATADPVSHPVHYTSHPSGVECKDVIGAFPHHIGAAVKYLWRAGLKSPDPIEDLRKAREFIKFEIERLGGKP